ncbi:Pc20g01740 [Penicillium rubens Wisconsin 54-1255]|uniref:Pc20g01740 protein n=2 Tax=Penicillium chrysogenum species complex TaxID=254878 RepID=B6HDQ9_PENRW|nr:Pc20g01740 [Penicillium rubens Wisconsin 54-1255]
MPDWEVEDSHRCAPCKMNRTAFFSSSIINNGSSNRQSCISFSLRPAPWDSAKILVHPSGYPIEAPPMYSIISKDSPPNVVLLRGWGEGPWVIVGDARLPTLSSKIHLTFYGQPIIMRLNQLSGNYALESPAVGQLKWRPDMFTGRDMQLQDATGRKLAKLRPGKSGEKLLEILVSHDSSFSEIVLLSGWTARAMTKSVTEATGEILSSVVGA